MNHTTAIPSEIRERIISAAVTLYEQAGRADLPTVDQVRRAAKADMNSTSTVMREWRRQQTAKAQPVAVTVPATVAQINAEALAALWQQAQVIANESLQVAQAGWETERAELDVMRKELADAYETQAAELDRVQASAADAEQLYQNQKVELAKSITRTERAETQVAEIERRVTDLRTELDRVHNDANERLTAAQADRDSARQEAITARVCAAELTGKLSASQEQLKALMEKFRPA